MEEKEAKKTKATSTKSTTAKKTTTTKKTAEKAEKPSTAKKTTTKKAAEEVKEVKETKTAKTTKTATKAAAPAKETKAAKAEAPKATKAAKAEKVEKAEKVNAEALTTNKAKRKAKKEAEKEARRLAPRATLTDARISARKVKIVIDNIRGKNVDEALAILKFTPKAASPLVEKLLKSAIANAENNNMMDRKKLYVAEVYANQGTTMKRIRAATQGRANRIRKRTSHITVVLKERA